MITVVEQTLGGSRAAPAENLPIHGSFRPWGVASDARFRPGHARRTPSCTRQPARACVGGRGLLAGGRGGVGRLVHLTAHLPPGSTGSRACVCGVLSGDANRHRSDFGSEGYPEGEVGGLGRPTSAPTDRPAALRCSHSSEKRARVSEAVSTNGTAAAGRPPLHPDRPHACTPPLSAAVPPAAPPLCSSGCVDLTLGSRPSSDEGDLRGSAVCLYTLFMWTDPLLGVPRRLARFLRPSSRLAPPCVAAAARCVGTPPAPSAQQCPLSRRPWHLALAVPSPTWAPQPAALPPLIEFLSEVGVALRRPFREAGRLDPVMGLFFAASPRRVRATAT